MPSTGVLGLKFMREDAEHIDRVLDELESLVYESSSVPMRRGRAALGRTEFLALLDELRDALPLDLDDSEKVRQERQEIIAEAEEEAQRTVDRAHERTESWVLETELYRRSRQEAEEVVSQAEQYAEELCGGSEDYRERALGKMEGWFQNSLNSVGKSRRELSNASSQSSSEPEKNAGGEDDGEGRRASSA